MPKCINLQLRHKRLLCLVLATIIISQGCSLLFTHEKPNKPRKSDSKKHKKRKSKKFALIWPIKGMLTSKFGIRKGKKHEGIDIGAPKGTKIVASEAGKVIFSGWGPRGYGKMIIIKHSSKYITVYAHNSKNVVSLGDTVKRGEKIGHVGTTGRTTGPHIHYEIRVNLVARDPLLYLSKRKKKKLCQGKKC